MTKEIEEKKSKKCFLITPIGGKNSEEFQKLGALEKNVYNIVLEEFGYELIIAHKIDEAGSIGDQVFKSILSADLIIANMTNLNANVMYEVAVAHSFGIPTVMISENGTKLPFDLISERTIFYDDSIEGCGLLISELRNKIEHLSKDGNFDNPVYRIIERNAVREKIVNSEDNDSLTSRAIFELQDQLDSLSRNLFRIIENENRSTSIIDPYSRTSYNETEVHVIGEYGYLSLKNIDLFSRKYINNLVETIKNLAEKFKRLPNFEEIESEFHLSPNIVSSMELLE